MNKGKQALYGFNLLELLIAVSIVALLATLAVPSYQQQIIKAGAIQAQADLLALAAKMEEFRLSKATYVGAAGTLNEPIATGLPWIHNHYSPSSVEPEQKNYLLYIKAADNHSYQLFAKPVKQLYQPLLYTSLGQKFWDRNGDGLFSDDEACWQCY